MVGPGEDDESTMQDDENKPESADSQDADYVNTDELLTLQILMITVSKSCCFHSDFQG